MTRTHAGTFWMPTRDMRAAGPFRNGVERAIASLARSVSVRMPREGSRDITKDLKRKS